MGLNLFGLLASYTGCFGVIAVAEILFGQGMVSAMSGPFGVDDLIVPLLVVFFNRSVVMIGAVDASEREHPENTNQSFLLALLYTLRSI